MEDSRMKRPFVLATIFGAKARTVLAVPLRLLSMDVAPVRILHLEERHPSLDRRVGHHDVDLAVIPFDPVGDLAQRADVPDVHLDGFTAPSEGSDQPDRVV